MPLHMVHILDLTGELIIAKYFWVGRPDMINISKRFRVDRRDLLNMEKAFFGGLPARFYLSKVL